MKVKILWSDSAEMLETKINEALKEDWCLDGNTAIAGCSVDNHHGVQFIFRYSQRMIKD